MRAAFSATSSAALVPSGHILQRLVQCIMCHAALSGRAMLDSSSRAAFSWEASSQRLAPSTPTTPCDPARRAVLRKNPRSPRLLGAVSLHAARIQIPGGAAAQHAAAATLLPLLSPLLSRHPCSSVCLPSPAWTPGSSQGLRAVAPPRRSTARGQTNAARAA